MKKVLSEIFDWIKTIVIIFIAVTLIQRYVFTPVRVDGQSMFSTLHDGDSVILWELGYQPSPFDVIVFEYSPDIFYVKRLIGFPGQTVRYENDQLYIDEVAVMEPYLEKAKTDVAEDSVFFSWDFNTGPFTEDFTSQDVCQINGFQECDVIPEGYFLVLGDNRPFSKDSRHIGLISEDQIMGRAAWIQWPLSRFGSIN